MAYKSRRQVLRESRSLRTDRFVDQLLVVKDHLGAEVIRVGGRWDRINKCYVDGPCTPRFLSLNEGQYEAGYCVAAYIRARLANDPNRIALLMLIGNRGGGKTFALALLVVLLELAIPGGWQAVVNITSKQKRDLAGAIKKIVGARSNPATGQIIPDPKGWVVADKTDLRDPATVFQTGSTLLWCTSKNPDAIRTGELDFEAIHINEGQSQPVEVFNNAAGTIRNKGGLVAIATNPPQRARGNYIARLYQAIDSQPDGQPRKGEAFIIVNAKNANIHQPTVEKIRWMLLAADRRAAEADADGVIKIAGDLGYPDFKALPMHRGGHLLDDLSMRRIASFWRDVTREETERVAGSAFDYVAGTDFQQNPGSCATIGKLFRDEENRLRRVVTDVVVTEGSNSDLSQGFISKRYYPGSVDQFGNPAPGRRLLLVGDATGKHQGPRHDFEGNEIYSYVELRAHGWTVIPPDRHWQTGVPRNPFIDESRRQMQSLFLAQSLLLGPACEQEHGRFPSVVEGFSNSLITTAGKFVKREHFTHFPDCERYVCWCFLDHPGPPIVDQSIDAGTFNLLASIVPQTTR